MTAAAAQERLDDVPKQTRVFGAEESVAALIESQRRGVIPLVLLLNFCGHILYILTSLVMGHTPYVMATPAQRQCLPPCFPLPRSKRCASTVLQ